MFLSFIFKRLGLTSPTPHENAEALDKAFHVKRQQAPDPDAVEMELITFSSSPSIRGENENAEGYFAGLPYAPAFGLYFVRSYLNPEEREKNYAALRQDIDHFANEIFEGNPHSSDFDKLFIQKRKLVDGNEVRQAIIGAHFYPTRDYIEAVLSPHLERLGIQFPKPEGYVLDPAPKP